MSRQVSDSRGIVSDRNRLYWDEFKQMPSVFPPSNEQESIVRFLDAHGRLINRLIRAKRRLIEVLTEQKQAIIHQAVTRGLDPNVRLKPSGIDWLGDVVTGKLGVRGVELPAIDQSEMFADIDASADAGANDLDDSTEIPPEEEE